MWDDADRREGEHRWAELAAQLAAIRAATERIAVATEAIARAVQAKEGADADA